MSLIRTVHNICEPNEAGVKVTHDFQHEDILTDVLRIPTRPTDVRSTAGSMIDVVLVEGDGVRRAGEDKTPVVVACGRCSTLC